MSGPGTHRGKKHTWITQCHSPTTRWNYSCDLCHHARTKLSSGIALVLNLKCSFSWYWYQFDIANNREFIFPPFILYIEICIVYNFLDIPIFSLRFSWLLGEIKTTNNIPFIIWKTEIKYFDLKFHDI